MKKPDTQALLDTAMKQHRAMYVRAELEDLIKYLTQEKLTGGKLLEIGCGRGGSTGIWSAFFKAVTTVCYEPFGRAGANLTDHELIERNKRLAGLKNVTLIHGNSHKLQTLHQVAAGAPFDVLWLDGDSTLEGITQDLFMYGQLLRPGGVLIMHNIKDHGIAHPCQVNQVWTQLLIGNLKRGSSEFTSAHGPDARRAGIGILHLPQDHGFPALFQRHSPRPPRRRPGSSPHPPAGDQKRTRPVALGAGGSAAGAGGGR